jgi:hypothetical protein
MVAPDCLTVWVRAIVRALGHPHDPTPHFSFSMTTPCAVGLQL